MKTIDHTAAAVPTLVIIRGNSGSGKSTVAVEVRRRYGRGCPLIEQDYLRRVVLREHGANSTPTVAPGFITAMVRAALGAGYHVVLEGILHTGQYGAPLRELIAEHPGRSAVFWMDVSFDETLRRHAGRPGMAHISAETCCADRLHQQRGIRTVRCVTVDGLTARQPDMVFDRVAEGARPQGPWSPVVPCSWVAEFLQRREPDASVVVGCTC